MTDTTRTHTAAIGLTFEEWNAWRGAARDAGYEHTSDWVRAVVADAIRPAAAPTGAADAAQDDIKRDLARELAGLGAHLGALTDELQAQPTSTAQEGALAGTDRVAAELSRLAQVVIDHW